MSRIIDTTSKDEVLKSLTELGLSAKEANVYTSLLALGECGSTAIAKESGLHRQFVYDTLAALEEKGLTGHTIIKGRKRFFPYPPSKLGGFFEQKKRVADTVVKQLEKSFLAPEIQELESYRGEDAFVANEFEIIKQAQPGSKVMVFGSNSDDYISVMGKYFEDYEYQRIKKDMEVMYIGSAVEKDKLIRQTRDRKMFKYRTLAHSSGELNIGIYEDGICFYLFGGGTPAKFFVRSKKIAQNYAEFFMGLWNVSK